MYPQSILVWHEIVNLSEHGLALTYCPLTGSCITYEYPEGIDTSLGTSGKLINSNLLMYDRSTDSFISQIDGIGLDQNLQGHSLGVVPTFWADWKDARDVYPEALVLMEDTGFIRDYNRDPYGSYTEDKEFNYYTTDGVIFPPLIANEDTPSKSDKHVVVGVKNGDERLAIEPEFVKDKGHHIFELAGDSFIAIHDESIDTVRVFDYNNEPIDDILQLEDLDSPIYFDVMWFAWYAFYPDTEVIE